MNDRSCLQFTFANPNILLLVQKTMLFGSDVEVVRRDASEPELESNRAVRFSSGLFHTEKPCSRPPLSNSNSKTFSISL